MAVKEENDRLGGRSERERGAEVAVKEEGDVAVCGVRQVTSHSPYATSCSTEQSEDFTLRSRTI